MAMSLFTKNKEQTADQKKQVAVARMSDGRGIKIKKK